MKVLTSLGTRPELIRLSQVIPKLDSLCDHVLVHTGQNYDYNLDGIFINQLGIRSPNYYLGAKGSFPEQIAVIFSQLDSIIINERPDAFLVLGDTNSSLGAIIAKKHGIRVFHMEAGNRCYDDVVPEEVNRRIIDHTSDILLPYTERSRQNLLAEGIAGQRIYVTGNPIYEVLEKYKKQIASSDVMDKMGVEAGKFFLVTLHRAENVDDEHRLISFIEALLALEHEYKLPIIWSMHPHTKNRLEGFKLNGLVIVEPLGLFDFIKLEQNAFCVLTDSGTVQEECAIFGVPSVTLRDSTERPETIETGCNFISGHIPEDVVLGVQTVTILNKGHTPPEYLVKNVSDTIVKIVLSYYDS